MKKQNWFTTFSTGCLVLLFAVIWVAFAPLQLGGQVAYVIVNGNSMEPLYHRGDLVIIRAQPDYQIGEIVTYRHPQIGLVIHRIIGREVERFVFKGDHNNFIDPYRPLRSELVGASWIYLPTVGTVVSKLRTPLNMALLAAVAGGIIMAPMISSTNQPTARKRRKQQDGQIIAPQQSNNNSLLIVPTLLAIVSIALAAFAFTRPTTRDVAGEITYQQTGVFGYSATAPEGIYDTTTIQTGDPLFPQLTRDATFTFNYQFEADQPTDLHGSSRLVAEVRATNGWQRTIELQPATAFSGSDIRASGVLELAQVQALIRSFEQQTGLLRQQYTLAIIPDMQINGTLAGHALQETFAPQLEFRLDAAQLQLLQASNAAQNPLMPAKAGLLTYTHTEPNILTMLFLTLEVPVARGIALGGLAVACMLGYLLMLGVLLHPIRRDQAAQIKSNYAALLIDVTNGDSQPSERIVEVATIGDLAKLAEKSGYMILHEHISNTDRYCIHDDGLCYCYQCASQESDLFALAQQLPPEIGATAQGGWQAIFLNELREKGTVSAACHRANISIAVAYEQRMRVAAFAQAWTEARATLRESPVRKVDL
jgi:signal peptidase I